MADAQALCSQSTPGQRPGPAAENQTDRELMERFLRRQDQAAFTALVQRHGPMVLGLCRRVLDHQQDAEDAFQATFVILVRRAGAIENPDLLGSWLYGVAYRTARKARARAARRRQQERQAASVTVAAEEPPADHTWQELRSALDRELNQLPEKYRLPLILCYLQGLTNEEAARRLGWPPGSMSYRLARGREMLRDRMQGRDRAAPAGFFALVLALRPDGGPLPGHLLDAAVQAAGAGAAQAGVLTGKVGALAEATLRGMTAGRRLLWSALLLLLGLATLSVAAVVLLSLAGTAPASPPAGGATVTQPAASKGAAAAAVPGGCHTP